MDSCLESGFGDMDNHNNYEISVASTPNVVYRAAAMPRVYGDYVVVQCRSYDERFLAPFRWLFKRISDVVMCNGSFHTHHIHIYIIYEA